MRRFVALFVVVVLLSACGSAGPLASPGGRAGLRLLPSFLEPGRQALAVVERLTKADVHHLAIVLLEKVGPGFQPAFNRVGMPVRLEVFAADLDRGIDLRGLKARTTYRLECRAFRGQQEDFSTLISDSTGSTTEVRTEADDTVVTSRLAVRLRDVPFSATAQAPAPDVSDGAIAYSGTPSIGVGAATVSTVAGSDAGYSDGPADDAQFAGPSAIAAGPGLLYVCDTENNRVRQILPGSEVSTLAGGLAGLLDGLPRDSRFTRPSGIAVLPDGSRIVADTGNSVLRRIAAAGLVSTEAGLSLGFADGQGLAAQFSSPRGLAVGPGGEVYVADSGNAAIRVVNAGSVTTLAGSPGKRGLQNGQGSAARFAIPSGIAFDPRTGRLLVADAGNHVIRIVSIDGQVITLAGTGVPGDADGHRLSATFDSPAGVAVGTDGTVYVADSGNNTIRAISPAGLVTTLAGSGFEGSGDGVGGQAEFAGPQGLAVEAAGSLLVADTGNHRIRRIEIPRRPAR
ncbi:MAG: SMP-30/gluconolactonase/LRE family protein [Candidatus Sericytochromatia bacterium]|nr:SMP-30/gluconolactonase/LRE family protein [Candidatus Tanganyikabacteria bacterium]